MSCRPAICILLEPNCCAHFSTCFTTNSPPLDALWSSLVTVEEAYTRVGQKTRFCFESNWSNESNFGTFKLELFQNYFWSKNILFFFFFFNKDLMTLGQQRKSKLFSEEDSLIGKWLTNIPQVYSWRSDVFLSPRKSNIQIKIKLRAGCLINEKKYLRRKVLNSF